MALESAKNGNDQTRDARENRLIWVDCEMTGLDLSRHRLVEIACIITEPDLSIVAEFGPMAITHPVEILDEMDEWCKETFKRNGLLERIKREGIEERDVEMKLLSFLREHVPAGKCPLAGNTVHMDRNFIRQYMPLVAAHFHYRIVDVSTIKELVNRWYAGTDLLAGRPEKRCVHSALDDIRESIEELQYYQKHFFVDSRAKSE